MEGFFIPSIDAFDSSPDALAYLDNRFIEVILFLITLSPSRALIIVEDAVRRSRLLSRGVNLMPLDIYMIDLSLPLDMPSVGK